jgi:hypothetical protein
MYKVLFGVVALLVVAAIIPVAVIAFTAPKSPPPIASIAEASGRSASRTFPHPGNSKRVTA